MHLCPHCRTELTEESELLEICPSCGVALLEEFPSRIEEPNIAEHLGEEGLERSTVVLSSEANVGTPPTQIHVKPADRGIAAGSEHSQGAQKQVPFWLFLWVASYACALTILILIFWLSGRIGNGGLLDLPDRPPKLAKDGEFLFPLVDEEFVLPATRCVGLGETIAFGNFRMTPLSITRGELAFEHYRDKAITRPSLGPVLLLKLEFENLSSDQTIAPLDQYLLYSRFNDPRDPERFRSNQFVALKNKHQKDRLRLLMYDLSISSEWEVEGQDLSPLAPGETREIILATELEPNPLEGSLLWRLHLRKGYNRQTHRGVTTILEVHFQSDEIEEQVPVEGNQEQNPSTG